MKMHIIIKLRIWAMFLLFTLLSGFSLFMKMSFYPRAITILFFILSIIRFLNTMIPRIIIIGVSLIILVSLYLFWNSYLGLNILGYIMSLLMLLVLVIDYINVVEAYGIFHNEVISEKELLYYLNPKYKLLLFIISVSFGLSFIFH
jgi:hypothetical protein